MNIPASRRGGEVSFTPLNHLATSLHLSSTGLPILVSGFFTEAHARGITSGTHTQARLPDLSDWLTQEPFCQLCWGLGTSAL